MNIHEGTAWLRFKCQGTTIHFDCIVQDDWVDTRLFERFVELLAKHDSNKVFVYCGLEGQDCIIGCTTRDGFAKLRELVPSAVALT